MNEFLSAFGEAIYYLNDQVPPLRNYYPGIGPYSENEIVRMAVEHFVGNHGEEIHILPNVGLLNNLSLNGYVNPNNNQARPDLIIGNNKIVEFKLCRPTPNDGGFNERWMTKIFDPVPKSGSAMVDARRLIQFRQNHDLNHQWELWVIVVGFEKHNEDRYQLDVYFPSLFTQISQQYLNTPPQECISETRVMSNRHPSHQTLKLYAFRY